MPLALTTGKMARYNGKGENPARFMIGDHAPPKSPFRYMPFDPYLAMTLDPKWFYDDWRGGYNANKWTVTEVDGGTDGAGAITQTTNLATLFTIDDADDDLQQLQHLHTWTPAANAFCACYFRARAAEATQSDMYLGMCSTDTSIVASAPADYAMWKKDDGDTILNGASNDAGGTPSETANIITDFTADTDYDFGITLVSTSTTVGTMFFQYKLASATAWNQVVKTTDFPDAAMRLTMLIQRGTTGASTMTIKRWQYAAYAGG